MKKFNIGDIAIPLPVIQGGMGIGISLSGLASAVANMGGVGVISTVGIGLISKSKSKNYRKNSIDAVRAEIRKARLLTKGTLGVNIMTVITNFSDMVKTAIEENIDIIFSGAGLPLDLPKYLTPGKKTKLVPIVSSARAASIISMKWKKNFDYLPDAFVVEGPKAGGHLGFKADDLEKESNTLENLVEDVVKFAAELKRLYTKDIPVIAAGGIYTGKDIYHIMEKGAAAVQLGTRFVATEECDAALSFKKAFVDAQTENIRIIKSPVGLPGRTIFNRFLQEAYDGKRRPAACRYRCIKTCDPATTTYCIAEALLAAYKGNFTDGFAFSGSNADQVKKISTVQVVFADLMKEYEEESDYQLTKKSIIEKGKTLKS
ncbi:MAG: nitronate monooxygenase [Bacteroidales bacterium]|nr:nitronate monooxygenase [Bacteroidales bacterium]